MLGARIASAVVLIPAVLLLLWLGPETTALTTAIAAAIGTYEFYTMSANSPFRFRPVTLVGYLAAIAFSIATYLKAPIWILAIAGVLVIVCFGYLLLAKTPKLASNLGISVFAPLYAGVPLALITLIRADLPNLTAIWWIVLICVATWGADTGGYAFGRMFGKHKLAPKISPKKTVEGALGGIATAVLGVALVGGLALNIPAYWTIPLGIILAIVSIVGDLFESWVKRRFDTKDSGKLIPGHGGLLDRVDSFLAVTLVATLFITFYVGF